MPPCVLAPRRLTGFTSQDGATRFTAMTGRATGASPGMPAPLPAGLA
jgi:hypothetical protein